MSSSYTESGTESFTLAHARKLASKVATDLKRLQRFYLSPPDGWIDSYEAEITTFLKEDVIESVVYGFKRNGAWTEAAVRYTARPGGLLSADDDPGKIRPGIDVAGGSFTSFLCYNARWWSLTEVGRAGIKASLPFQRSSGSAPPLETGIWADDLNYLAGGRALGRSTVRR
jgi:hypothetical protein